MALENLEPTDVFFEKILHRGLQDKTIHNVVLVKKELATQKGENFLSCLTKLTLKYVCNVSKENNHEKIEKTAHLILKEEPIVNEKALENIREMEVFNTERQLLEEVIPKIEELVDRRLAPKVYYSSIEPQVIVMEDMTVQGFKNSSRILGLNQEQCLMVLESLADFHAGSVLMNEKNPGSLKQYTRGLVNPDMPPMFFKTMQTTVANAAKQIGSWPDKKFTQISKKLEKISHHVIERVKEVCMYDNDEFCVLNHGDLWINNIMFQNDEKGKLKDVRLLDYQFVVWSSPIIDLCYFLNAAPEPSLKGTNDDLFLETYLTRLSNTMKKIGCTSKPPTMDHLKKSLHKRRIFPLLCGVWFFPKMTAEGGEMETIEDIFYTEKDKIDIMQNRRVKAVVEKMLPIWDERGYGTTAVDNLEHNDVFFRKVLQEGLRDETIEDVVRLNQEPATKKGENYLSILTRLNLKYVCSVSRGNDHEKVEKIANLILKEEPDVDQETMETIHKMDIFNVEQQLLEEVVPKVETLIGRRLSARVYHCSMKPRMIAMEDLSVFGFKNIDRKAGLNRDQTCLILENIAEFHAGSIRLDEQDPGCLTRFSIGLLNMTPSFYKRIENTIKNVALQIRTWPDPKFLPLSEKLEKISKDAVKRLKEIYRSNEDEICVLNHGDLWSNNIMFQYDDGGKLQELRLVDFQVPNWTSPAIDLLYFLSISPRPNLKVTYDDIFLQKYLTRLSSTMKKLNCSASPPTLQQLKVSMYKRRAFAVMGGLGFWPKTLVEEEDFEAMDTILEKGFFMRYGKEFQISKMVIVHFRFPLSLNKSCGNSIDQATMNARVKVIVGVLASLKVQSTRPTRVPKTETQLENIKLLLHKKRNQQKTLDLNAMYFIQPSSSQLISTTPFG
ncbi:uncharacterized protein LOC107040561 [Diachasma alloeum]|uniref:uncharacterized protein LOC107040561 n=1 Tax=Diachasma alloeum TaxID=454923 RepID=UPI0010FB9AC4|nr:uncharacterized protein LOC107040561 [Diachasma alloeum]